MTRQSFIVAIAALIVTPACALRGTPAHSISGYVFRFGVRFGRRDIRVPNVPVTLQQWGEKVNGYHPLNTIAKTRTNTHGEYHFRNVAPGWYYVQADGGPWRFVRVESAPVWVNIFQEYRGGK